MGANLLDIENNDKKIVVLVNKSKKKRENIPFDFEINLDLAISSVIGQEV